MTLMRVRGFAGVPPGHPLATLSANIGYTP
jgi:hypothetical protein